MKIGERRPRNRSCDPIAGHSRAAPNGWNQIRPPFKYLKNCRERPPYRRRRRTGGQIHIFKISPIGVVDFYYVI